MHETANRMHMKIQSVDCIKSAYKPLEMVISLIYVLYSHVSFISCGVRRKQYDNICCVPIGGVPRWVTYLAALYLLLAFLDPMWNYVRIAEVDG